MRWPFPPIIWKIRIPNLPKVHLSTEQLRKVRSKLFSNQLNAPFRPLSENESGEKEKGRLRAAIMRLPRINSKRSTSRIIQSRSELNEIGLFMNFTRLLSSTFITFKIICNEAAADNGVSNLEGGGAATCTRQNLIVASALLGVDLERCAKYVSNDCSVALGL